MIVGDCQAIVGRVEAAELIQRQITVRSVRCGHKLPCLSESMRWQSLNIMEALLNDPTTNKVCHMGHSQITKGLSRYKTGSRISGRGCPIQHTFIKRYRQLLGGHVKGRAKKGYRS